jgi:guanylate kinase
MERVTGLHFSVSHTTRPRREREREGVDYFFVSPASFECMIREERFLEWARVHDNLYGTSRAWVEERLAQGEDVVLDIDVQGASQVKERMPESVQILVFPPSYSVLRERLVARRSDDPDTVERRLRNARGELGRFPVYDYVIINEELGTAVENLISILRCRRVEMPRLKDRIECILSTFPQP